MTTPHDRFGEPDGCYFCQTLRERRLPRHNVMIFSERCCFMIGATALHE
jgi:hypothetical protein